MVSELALHFERHSANDLETFDWVSPSGRTQIVCCGSRLSLHQVFNQDAKDVVAEYMLQHDGGLLFSAVQYRWPYMQSSHRSPLRAPSQSQDDDETFSAETSVSIPSQCMNELLAYHTSFQTGWLLRYRASERLADRSQIDKVGIVA